MHAYCACFVCVTVTCNYKSIHATCNANKINVTMFVKYVFPWNTYLLFMCCCEYTYVLLNLFILIVVNLFTYNTSRAKKAIVLVEVCSASFSLHFQSRHYDSRWGVLNKDFYLHCDTKCYNKPSHIPGPV